MSDTIPGVNRTFNARGFRRQPRSVRLAVIERLQEAARIREAAVKNNELPCWRCYGLFPIGTETCPKCGAGVGSQPGNKVVTK